MRGDKKGDEEGGKKDDQQYKKKDDTKDDKDAEQNDERLRTAPRYGHDCSPPPSTPDGTTPALLRSLAHRRTASPTRLTLAHASQQASVSTVVTFSRSFPHL